MKVFAGVAGVLAASGALFYAIRIGGKVFFYFSQFFFIMSGGVFF
jgi:hypothetical protein